MLEREVSRFGGLGCSVVGMPSCQHAGSQDHLGWGIALGLQLGFCRTSVRLDLL